MIKCDKCGLDNLPGHLYCSRCRTKLNLEQISHEYFSGPEKPGHFARQILLGIVLFLIVVLGLAIWPRPITAISASTAEQTGALGKMKLLQQGVASDPVVFSGKEVNILFAYLLRELPGVPNRNAEQTAFSTGKITIQPDAMAIQLNYRLGLWKLLPIKLGPFVLTCTVTGVPARGADGLNFSAHSGVIGHLPLPLVGGHIGTERLKQIFRPFKKAQAFLSGLEVNSMGEDSITVSNAR